jgi:predicted nucleic acid-binding protein
MHENKQIVMNTGPILALIAGLGNLNILKSLYKKVIIPYEVCGEIFAGGISGFGVEEFNGASFLYKIDKPVFIQPHLRNSLDLGESSVIQTALNKNIHTVCIDEAVGRRVARLNDLKITGSLGIMIRAKNEGHSFVFRDAINQMKSRGIWLSDRLITSALKQIDNKAH